MHLPPHNFTEGVERFYRSYLKADPIQRRRRRSRRRRRRRVDCYQVFARAFGSDSAQIHGKVVVVVRHQPLSIDGTPGLCCLFMVCVRL
jgi:hypothetical protein